MLGLYVLLGRERSKRFEIAKEAVSIGSDEQNDLVLRDGEVAPFHCRLLWSGSGWFLAPPGEIASEAALRPLADGASVSAGLYTIVLALDAVVPDPVERSLLDQIAAGDEASRLVYADWLEARGEAPRAEFLRLQQSLAGIDPTDPAVRARFRAEVHRLRELSGRLDAGWRRRVGRPAVEGCRQATFDVRCPMDWGKLARTADPDVRRCDGCGDHVHFASSLEAARRLRARGLCVALELSVERSPGDLRPLAPAPGYIA